MPDAEQPATGGPFGYQQPQDDGSAFSAHRFFVKSLIAQISTAKWVEIKTVTASGAAASIGTVTVQLLVNQVDSLGNSTPHGQIYSLQYLRIAGGENAVIMDPQVGDVGVAVFADRDSSSVIANGGQANPGSFRKHDMADGFYLGMGWSGAPPTQYVAFSTAGIAITSPTAIVMNAPTIELTSPSVAISGAVFTHNGKNVGSTHQHSDVMNGGGNSGPPI